MVIRCYQGFSSVKMATQLYKLATDISKHYSGLFLSFWYIELKSFLLLDYLCLYHKFNNFTSTLGVNKHN